MARLPKPSVRYELPNKRTDDCSTCIQFRGIASYNRKRLSFPLSAPDYVVLPLFFAFKSDGSIKKDAIDYIAPDIREKVTLYSKMLQNLSSAICAIIELAVKKEVWGRMTSTELRSFITFFDWNAKAEITNLKQVIGIGGLFDTWAKKTI